MNKKIVKKKKEKVTFIDDSQSMNMLIQFTNIVPKEGRWQKRMREESQMHGGEPKKNTKALEGLRVLEDIGRATNSRSIEIINLEALEAEYPVRRSPSLESPRLVSTTWKKLWWCTWWMRGPKG